MPTYTELFRDTFHRANEQPLNPANYAASSDFSTDVLAVVNNLCVAANNFDQEGFEFYIGSPIPPDQYATVTINQWQFDGSSLAGISGRSDGSATKNCYSTQLFLKTLQLVSFVNGVPTVLRSVNMSAVNSGDILRMEMFGSLISVLYNGVVLISVTDTKLTSGKLGPLVGWSGTQTDTSISLFTAGSIIASADTNQIHNSDSYIYAPKAVVGGTSLVNTVLGGSESVNTTLGGSMEVD